MKKTLKRKNKRKSRQGETIIRMIDVAKGFFVGLFSFTLVVEFELIPGLSENIEKHSGLYTAILATFAAFVALEAARENIKFYAGLKDAEQNHAKSFFGYLSAEMFSRADGIKKELEKSGSTSADPAIIASSGITRDKISILFDESFLSKLENEAFRAADFRDSIVQAIEYGEKKAGRATNKEKIITVCKNIMISYGMPENLM